MPPNKKRRNPGFLLCAAAVVPLHAAANTAANQATAVAPGELETVLVTGQRTYYDSDASSASRVDLPILETPQSLFVINADLIADQQAFRFDQILQNDSSVQKANNFLGAYSSYQIRGLMLANGSNYFRDGRTFFHLSAPPVEVLERVEVLKGPASVLYGTLAPGGIINMIPKRPQADYETSVKVTTGDYDFNHIQVDHGGPIGNQGDVRYRVNGAYEKSESFREFGDGSAFETERAIVAAALDWDIGENTLLRLNADYTEDDRPQDIGLISLDGDLSRLDYDTIVNQPWSFYNSEVSNIFLEAGHQLNDSIKLRGGISYQDYMRDRYDNQYLGAPDEDGNVNIRARHRINRYEYTTYFADLIAGFDTGPLSHLLLAGIDKTDVERDNNETAENVFFSTNIYAPQVIPDPHIRTSPDKNLGDEDRVGLTLQDIISIGDHWRVTLGGRYDDYDSSFSIAGVPVEGQPEATNFTPRFGVVYLPQDNLSLYASYSESFEPNGVVGSGYDNAGEALDPTIGEQLEAGIKWETLGGQVLATAAAFSLERSQSPIEDQLGQNIIQRGTQEHKGVEFTVTGLASENLTLHGSGTYLDAQFTVDDNPDIIGNTPGGVAEWTLAFTADYEFLSGVIRGLSVNGGVFYESDRPVDDANSYELDSYLRLDAGIKYVLDRGEASDFIFRISGHNLTNEEYFKGSETALNPERPREFRFSVEAVL